MEMKQSNIKAKFSTVLLSPNLKSRMNQSTKGLIHIPLEQWHLASIYLERHLLDSKLGRVVKRKSNLSVQLKKIRPIVHLVQVPPKKIDSLSRKRKMLSVP